MAKMGTAAAVPIFRWAAAASSAALRPSVRSERAGIREGVSEMRIDVGQGYRLYFTPRDRVLVILLMGGTKATQSTDVQRAINMAKEI